MRSVLRDTALLTLLSLGLILATAYWQEAPPPTAKRPTAVAAGQSRATSSPSPSPLVPRGRLAEVYPELGNLAAARGFTINSEGGGLIAIGRGTGTRVDTHVCALTRTQTEFAGTCSGHARVTRMYSDFASLERRYELPVHVPVDAAERFLRDLTSLPVADGPYQVRPVPDSRAHHELTIYLDADSVRMYSDAWGADGPRPWAVEYGGRRMVIDSAAPWQAQEPIRPYLAEFGKVAQEQIDEMIPALEAEPSPSPAAR